MRQGALRLLLLGPQRHFWMHATDRAWIAGHPGPHARGPPGEGSKADSSTTSEDAAFTVTSSVPPTSMLPPPPQPWALPPSPLQQQQQQQPPIRAYFAFPALLRSRIAAASSPLSTIHCRTARSRSPCGSPADAAASSPAIAATAAAADTTTTATATTTATQIAHPVGAQTVYVAATAGADGDAQTKRQFSADGSKSISLVDTRQRRVRTSEEGPLTAGRPKLDVAGRRHASRYIGGRSQSVGSGSAGLLEKERHGAGTAGAAAPEVATDATGHLRGMAGIEFAASGQLLHSSDLLQGNVNEILTAARQAVRSRNAQMRRASARLLAWLDQRPQPPEHAAQTAGAAARVGRLPAIPSSSKAMELAGLCLDLSITNKAAWDKLLDAVAGSPAATAASEGVLFRHTRCQQVNMPAAAESIHGKVQLVEQRNQKLASILLAWEYALVLRAAAACGRTAAEHPQLYVLQEALSTLTHRYLVPGLMRGCTLEGSGGQQGLQEPLCEPREDGQCGPDGELGLAALLHVAGELTPLPGDIRQAGQLAAAVAASTSLTPTVTTTAVSVTGGSRTVLAQPGMAEAVLRKLLAVTQEPWAEEGIVALSLLGAASSLRAALVAWRVLRDDAWRPPPLLAITPVGKPPPASAPMAVGIGSGGGVEMVGPPPPVAALDTELLHQLGLFVQTRANLLLPEPRRRSSADGDVQRSCGGGSSSGERAIQQMTLAWTSSPDLHRYPGLSRAVWDVLPLTAALITPGVPWVGGGSKAAPVETWLADEDPRLAPLATSLGSGATTAGLLLLSELCRLAAATFYCRTKQQHSDVTKPGSTSGNTQVTPTSSGKDSISSSTLSGSYSPSAADLLMLVHAVEAIRHHTASAVITAAPGSSHSVAVMEPSSATGGAGGALETIVLAASSAHLRRVTRLLEWKRQPWASLVGKGEDGQEEGELGLPVSALLTEYLARRSHVPDWHLIWRLLRHHHTAAAEIAVATAESVSMPPLNVDMDTGPDDGDVAPAAADAIAAAWAVRAAAAAAERVLRSTDDELRRWCWPRTAVRLAEVLAESLRLRAPEARTSVCDVECRKAGAPLMAAAAAERLLLHAMPTILAAPEPELTSALAWLRSAAALEGGRQGQPEDASSDGTSLPGALAAMAAHVEDRLRQIKEQQRASFVTPAVAATSDRRLDSVHTDPHSLGGPWDGRSGSTTITTNNSGTGRDTTTQNLESAGAEAEAGAGLGPGIDSGVGTTLEAIGQLLEADARVPAGYLPLSLMEGCLKILAGAAEARAAALEWQQQRNPWDCPPPQSSVGGGNGSGRRPGSADGTEGCGGEGGDDSGAAGRAAAQALSWLAQRQLLLDSELLSPLLKTVVDAAVEFGAREVGEARARQLKGAVPKQHRRRQEVFQQQQLAAATLAVAKLAEIAAADLEGADMAPQLHDTARQLAVSLLRASPDRLPLPQMAALFSGLWQLQLADAQLLLHLTECQRQHQQQHQQQQRVHWCSSAAVADAAMIRDTTAASATAASQLLHLAAAVLCSPTAVMSHDRVGRSSSLTPGAATSTTTTTTTNTNTNTTNTITTTTTTSAAPFARKQLAEAAGRLGSWLSLILCRGLEMVPPEQLVTAWYAAHALARVATADGVNPLGDAAGSGDSNSNSGDGDAVLPHKSSGSWLSVLSAAATRRLLATGVDGLLLHQLAALSWCLAESADFLEQLPSRPQKKLNRHDDCTHPNASDVHCEAMEGTRVATVCPTQAVAPEQKVGKQTAGWLSWWGESQPPQRPTAPCSDAHEGGSGMLSRRSDEQSEAVAAPAGAEEESRPALLKRRGLILNDFQQEQIERLQQLVREALLHRATRHGDTYEAPADVACTAFRDLAAAGALRVSPMLAASLVDGLVFRLADEAGIDGLRDVTAALAAGRTDPWVTNCAARGLLDELATGLQRRLRLQPEDVTTAHLTAMAADMHRVATAATRDRDAGATTTVLELQAGGGEGGLSTATALMSSNGVLRVLSRALAARSEQLSPEQALDVAALFSAPRMRDTHLLQRLTEAVETTPEAAAGGMYTAEQLLQLGQCLYSAGLRDQQLFTPLARALRARARTPPAATAAAAAAAAAVGDGNGDGSDGNCGSGSGSGTAGGATARTLQAAAAMLRAVRLNADADALQQAFVLQMRAGGSSGG